VVPFDSLDAAKRHERHHESSAPQVHLTCQCANPLANLVWTNSLRQQLPGARAFQPDVLDA